MRAAHMIGRLCAICGRPAEHLDHITPLIRAGTDHPTNLQPLCAECNLRKGAE
jgi:5-methylcytosine-specific restriction protein A